MGDIMESISEVNNGKDVEENNLQAATVPYHCYRKLAFNALFQPLVRDVEQVEYLEDDRDNPRNWAGKKKVAIACFVVLCAFVA
jgi:hypothetical protein